MMEKPEIHQLIRLHLSGELSEEGKKMLTQWEHESKQNAAVLKAFENTWSETKCKHRLPHTDKLAEDIWERGVGSRKNRIRAKFTDWNYFLKIAAIFIFFVSTPFLLYRLIILPEQSENEEVKYIVKQTPAGQKLKLQLPDATFVWLNSGSSLRYPSEFSMDHRLVELQGEAFFEVATDTLKPFVVKTSVLEVTALGTSFNVNSYDNLKYIKVSLVTGIVKVDVDKASTILNPGHQVVYNSKNKQIQKNTFDPQVVTGWKEGVLYFDGETFEEVKRKLEKWYGIRIKVLGTPPKDWRLTAWYENESLVSVLNNIQYSREFEYELNDEWLILNFMKK